MNIAEIKKGVLFKGKINISNTLIIEYKANTFSNTKFKLFYN